MSSTATTARRIERMLDRLHFRARSSLLLRYFATINRILLAIGFVPTAMFKILGQRFTNMGSLVLHRRGQNPPVKLAPSP